MGKRKLSVRRNSISKKNSNDSNERTYGSDGLSFDSDEDLPSVSLESPQKAQDKGEPKKNDVVWVPYKDIHWPAVVTSVKMRMKEARVLYVNENRGSDWVRKFKLKDVLSFDDPKKNMELRQIGEKRFIEFREAYELVTQYFLQKQNKNLSAIRFLTIAKDKDVISRDKDYLYRLGFEGGGETEQEDDACGKSFKSDSDEELETEETNKSNKEYEETRRECERLTDLSEETLQSLRQEAQLLLPIISSTECRKLLQDIKDKTVKSERHMMFPSPKLIPLSGLGAFNNFVDLYSNLLDIFEPFSVDPLYKIQVLMPEAIIYALSKLNGWSQKRAEDHYLKTCAMVSRAQVS